MNFKNLFLPFLLLQFFIGAEKSLATHVAGGRITYTYMAPNQYLVTLTVYRDCSPGTATLGTTATICYSSVSTMQAANFVVTLLPGSGNILPPANCYPPVTPCFEEYIFQGTVTLPGVASDWIFSWGMCCRSLSISTISSAGGTGMVIYTTLDNLTYAVNSSPFFINPPYMFYCINQPSTYVFTCNDIDGDSLVYSLAPVQDGTGCPATTSNATYIAPYSATNPVSSLTPIVFNPATGVLNFTPDVIQVGLIDGLIEEYRNGILIGSVKTETIVLIIAGITNPDMITGKVYFDNNNNQVYDTGDQPKTGAIIETTPGNYYGSSNLAGDYLIYEPVGSYLISIPNPPLYYSSQPAVHTAAFAVPFQTDSLNDFRLTVTDSVYDIRIALTGSSIFIIGFDGTFYLTYSNVGTMPVSGSINLVHDNLISYLSSTTPPDTISGDTLSWSFSNLMPLTGGGINIEFHLPAGTPPGTPLFSYAEILPLINDTVPADNSDTLYQTAEISCDPNFKVVEPSTPITTAQVTNGEFLEYTIHFQNTGTAPAVNVIITDTLDLNFNIPTFEVLAASHNYTWNMNGQGIIEFSFPNIMLPDSGANEPASHGFIKYRIKPKNNLVIGDKMLNTAYIFFDSNAPVVTNTTSTTVIYPASVSSVTQNNFDIIIYPNPSNDFLTIEMNLEEHSAITFEIFNTLGLLIKKSEDVFQTGLNKKQINLVNQPSGVYFLKITLEKGMSVLKFVLE